MTNPAQYVLKLTVNNHAGVLSHICGLFARRGYNLDGVMVRPIQGQKTKRSLMWLLLNEDQTQDDKHAQQIMRQTEKLFDVIDIKRQSVKGSVFEKTTEFFQE